jgi:mRNA interferase RelE/StbE
MWKIEWKKSAKKEFITLDKTARSVIEKAIDTKLLTNPDVYLIPLVGDLTGLYKFRVGDYRLLCLKEENVLIITVVKVKHRREVYEKI